MKQISLFTLFLAVNSAVFAQSKNDTFTGELMDKQCAQMGSHETMMKAENAKNAKECTLACAKDGGLALLDPQTKKAYSIDDESKVREYAGERVRITGNYDQGADVLHVKTVERAR